MDAPNFFFSMGGISIVMGVIFFFLKKPISLLFCNFGKWTMKLNPLFDQEMVNSFYDEKRFLRVFPVFGIILVVQGSVMLAVGWFL